MFRKDRHLPYLSDYLRALAGRTRPSDVRVAAFGGIVGAIGGLSGALIGLLTGFKIIHLEVPVLVALMVGLPFISFGVIACYWAYERKRSAADGPEFELTKEAIATARHLMQFVHRKRLHRVLAESGAGLLEESAKNWHRINVCLAEPYWNAKELPAHWQSIREQTKAAADRAMEEMLVLLRSAIRPELQKAGWEEFVEDVVESFVERPSPPRSVDRAIKESVKGYMKVRRGQDPDLLPVGFDQAREIAERLKLLASEFERSSKQILKEEKSAIQFRSADALDLALTDIRSVQTAEEELRQNLSG